MEDLTLDCLPFDCIVLICEYLTASDLGRFSRSCQLFYEASLVGYIWRRHCLSRWTFCDISQIPDGPKRWRRYFIARRQVDASLDTGRPRKDYKVKTLRGHEQDITSALVIGGSQVNWEDPQPPLIVSLSSDGNVKAWDIKEAQPVWSLGGQGVTSIATKSASSVLATAESSGRISLWNTKRWNVFMALQARGGVTAIKYGTLNAPKLPHSILLAHVSGNMRGDEGHIEVWDPELEIMKEVRQDQGGGEEPGPPVAIQPLFELWAPVHDADKMQLSSSGLLAVPGDRGDVHVWQLPSLPSTTAPPPIPPHITINTAEVATSICWVQPGLLATVNGWRSTNIELWDVGAHLDAKRKAGRRMYDDTNMYNPTRTIACDVPLTAMSVANDKIIAGDIDGNIRVLDPSTQALGCLQKFSNHKGTITDVFADRFRVLSCSKDFSIRVYRWKRDPQTQLQQLESRYTLLGGSVAHKTHDGFDKLLCEAASCVGIAGKQLKFYTFSCQLPASQ